MKALKTLALAIGLGAAIASLPATAQDTKIKWVWLFLSPKEKWAQLDHFTRRRWGREWPCTGATFPSA